MNDYIGNGKYLISVVLPVYNGEKTVSKAIESVLEQSYSNLELIIVNDCSTDKTREILEYYKNKDNRIKIINNSENQKLPKSLNIGFSYASGEYLTWTSDDNTYHNDALEILLNTIIKGDGIDLVYSDFNIIDLDGNLLYVQREGEPGALLNYNTVGACFLYSRRIANLVGEYNPERFLVEDYDYWIRIYLTGKMKHIKDVLYEYGWHDNSLTMKNKGITDKKEAELKSVYLDELLKRCDDQDEINKYYWKCLSLINNEKERNARRNEFYQINAVFAKTDRKKRFDEQRTRIKNKAYSIIPEPVKYFYKNLKNTFSLKI